MERETYRNRQFKKRNRVRQIHRGKQGCQGLVEKVKVFKYRKNSQVTAQTRAKPECTCPPLGPFDRARSKIVDRDREGGNKNVQRSKAHVEVTACRQQNRPLNSAWRQKVKGC